MFCCVGWIILESSSAQVSDLFNWSINKKCQFEFKDDVAIQVDVFHEKDIENDSVWLFHLQTIFAKESEEHSSLP